MSNSTIIPHNAIEETIQYPAKYELQSVAPNQSIVKMFTSLILYLMLGYVLLRRWDVLFLITTIVLIHELGHFIAMKLFDYHDTGIFFIPFFGAFVSGNKREISQKQSAIIFLAGPVPGILIGFTIYFIGKYTSIFFLGNLSLEFIANLFIWLNIINLLPIYPLDGGQLLNRLFLDEEGTVSQIFIILSALLITFFAVYTRFYILLILPAFFIYRYISTLKYIKLEHIIHLSGINLNASYNQLSNDDYWKVRTLLIENLSTFAHIKKGPPYEFDSREDKIAHEIENLLQRNLIQDATIGFKVIVALLWLLVIFSPWILNAGLSFLHYFKLF